MRIHTLCCGSMGVTGGAIAGGSRLVDAVAGQALPKALRRRLPVCTYLIEHPKGLILIDTGWSRTLFPDGRFSPEAAKELMPPSLYRYFQPELPVGQSAVERLNAMGIAPKELDYVILTQLTADHTQGLRDFRDAKKRLVNENERYWSCRTVFKHLQPRVMWEEYGLDIFYMRGTPIGPDGHSYDLFGDGSVIFVETNGYTTGQTSVLLQGKDGKALISSDTAFTADNLRRGIITGHQFYVGLGQRSLNWLQKQANAPDCQAVLVNHDPAALTQGIVEI